MVKSMFQWAWLYCIIQYPIQYKCRIVTMLAMLYDMFDMFTMYVYAIVYVPICAVIDTI